MEGYSCEDIVATARNGKLTRRSDPDGCHYMYWSFDCQEKLEYITVGMKTDSGVVWIDSTRYVLLDDAKNDVAIFVGGCYSWHDGKKECAMKKESLLGRLSFYGDLWNWDIELPYPVQRYSVTIYRGDSVIYLEENTVPLENETPVRSVVSSPGLKLAIERSLPNDIIKFYNVVVSLGECEFVYEGPSITIE